MQKNPIRDKHFIGLPLVNPNLNVLRNNDDLYIPQSRLTLADKFLLFLYPTLWSNFEDHAVKIQ